MTSKDLEDRLIGFAVNIIKLSNGIISSYAGNTMAAQLVRSCSSIALNYGEAQSAESEKILSINWESV
jgi:four helix bundle protein